MSIKKQIAHNTAAQMVGKIISTLLGLIAIAMMTRYLGTEKFGWYGTTLAFLQFIGILIDFGLIPVTSQMMSEVPKELDEKKPSALKEYRTKLLKNLLGFRLTTAIVFLGLAPVIALFFPYPREVKIAISFTTISMLSVCINQIFIGFYQSRLATYMQAFGEVVGRIFLVTGIYLCMYLDLGFLPVMWVVTLSGVAYTAVLWLHTRKRANLSFGFDLSMWKKIAIKMWPIGVSIMFNVIYLRGDTVILSVFKDQHEVGLYVAAYRVIDIISQTAMMIMGLMLPLLAMAWSRGENRLFKEHFQLSFNIMMMLAIPMAIGISMLSREIIVAVAGVEYVPAAIPLTLLSIAIIGLFAGAMFGHVAVAIDRQKQTIPVYLFVAITTLILYFLLIPRYGMYGAAAASVFSEIASGFLLYHVIKKHSKCSISLLVTTKILLAGTVMAGIIFFTKTNLILAILVGASSYAVMLLATRAISLNTIKEITSLKKA